MLRRVRRARLADGTEFLKRRGNVRTLKPLAPGANRILFTKCVPTLIQQTHALPHKIIGLPDHVPKLSGVPVVLPREIRKRILQTNWLRPEIIRQTNFGNRLRNSVPELTN